MSDLKIEPEALTVIERAENSKYNCANCINESILHNWSIEKTFPKPVEGNKRNRKWSDLMKFMQ